MLEGIHLKLIKIESIQILCTNDNIRITKHAGYRLEERNIKLKDVKFGIMSGEIIEDYPTDHPNPSVLILGFTDKSVPIHVVVGVGDSNIQIITAYYPSLSKWEDNLKVRKAAK